MACESGRTGMVLDPKQREKLLKQIDNYDGQTASTENIPSILGEEGCLICKQDNDHSNTLLCEVCNGEYHIYCLDPPLEKVPDEEWYCDKCKAKAAKKTRKKREDGLDLMVAALPPRYTERFGEIVWASGGQSYGYWPSYIYDPRMTVGVARDLARKNLGKRHLVYFFQCFEAPFAVLPDSKMMNWYEGIAENHHLGKTARHASKTRAVQFEEALKVAVIEISKPIENRMDWNHPTSPVGSRPALPAKQISSFIGITGESRSGLESANNTREAASPLDDTAAGGSNVSHQSRKRLCTRRNLLATLAVHNAANTDEQKGTKKP